MNTLAWLLFPQDFWWNISIMLLGSTMLIPSKYFVLGWQSHWLRLFGSDHYCAQYPIYQACWWACYAKWCQEVLVKYRFIRFFLSLYLRSLSSCHTAWEMISSWLCLRQKEQTHCHLPFFAWVMLTAECSERLLTWAVSTACNLISPFTRL